MKYRICPFKSMSYRICPGAHLDHPKKSAIFFTQNPPGARQLSRESSLFSVPRSELRLFGDVARVPSTALLTVGFGSVKRQKDYVLAPRRIFFFRKKTGEGCPWFSPSKNWEWIGWNMKWMDDLWDVWRKIQMKIWLIHVYVMENRIEMDGFLMARGTPSHHPAIRLGYEP